MLLRKIIQIVLVSILLFGGTFSCTAFGMHFDTVGQQDVISPYYPDDCCPKDGHHTSNIDGQGTVSLFQKDDSEVGKIILGKNILNDDYMYFPRVQQHHSKIYYIDKQSFFFTDTIRLLL